MDFDAWGNYHTVLHNGDNGLGIAVAAFAPQLGMGYVILVNASGKPAWDALTSVQNQIRAYLQTRRDSEPGNGKIPFASQALNCQKPVIVNNVWNNSGSYTADKAVDDDVTTRWATDQRSAGHCFLESDLGSEQTIGGVLIRSNPDHNWRTVVAGGRLSQETYIKLNPVMARYVRLELDSDPQAEPTLSAFLIFPPGFDYDRF